MSFKIIKNAPIPKAHHSRLGRGFAAACRKLEIGDSVILPRASTRISGLLKGLRAEGRCFTVRSLGDGTTQVWRIEGNPKKENGA